MRSYSFGKAEVCTWVRRHFPVESSILDVGAGSGTWRKLLPEYSNMDALEIFEPYLEQLRGYRRVICADVRKYEYEPYDLIVFGDVLEHMSVRDAREVLEYALPRCRDLIVAVPYLYRQGACNGNLYEAHVQDDLTPRIFAERYPELTVLHDTGMQYCYYHRLRLPREEGAK